MPASITDIALAAQKATADLVHAQAEAAILRDVIAAGASSVSISIVVVDAAGKESHQADFSLPPTSASLGSLDGSVRLIVATNLKHAQAAAKAASDALAALTA